MSDHDLVVCPCGSSRQLECLYPRCHNGDSIFEFQEEWGRAIDRRRHWIILLNQSQEENKYMENQLTDPTDSSINIIVSYYQFSISAPYQPGPHTLTVGEASALNALRADHLRKIASRRVADLTEPNRLLSPSQLSSIQFTLAECEDIFEFKPRRLDDPNRKSLLQQEREAVLNEKHPKSANRDLEAEARRRLLARLTAIAPSDLGF